MDHSRAVFWLGNLDRRYKRQPVNRLIDQGRLSGNERLCSFAFNSLLSGDQKLVEDVLQLFDGALDLFDRQRDYQTQMLIDQLALAVMNCIRNYIRAGPSY